MNLHELFKMQQKMEEHISLLSGIKEDALGEDNTIHLRFVALQVKIGELANLTKCYKYNKGLDNLPKSKVLLRYLDGMKYLLSLGNKYQLNVINGDNFSNIKKHDNLVLLFSEIFEALSSLKKHLIEDSYVESLNRYIYIFAKYINLAETLGITYDEAYNYFEDINISA